jgi:hypothetical protein
MSTVGMMLPYACHIHVPLSVYFVVKEESDA